MWLGVLLAHASAASKKYPYFLSYCDLQLRSLFVQMVRKDKRFSLACQEQYVKVQYLEGLRYAGERTQRPMKRQGAIRLHLGAWASRQELLFPRYFAVERIPNHVNRSSPGDCHPAQNSHLVEP